MFGFGMFEFLLIVLILVLFCYGGKKFPQIGQDLGRSITEFKKGIRGRSAAPKTPSEQSRQETGRSNPKSP
ncbi:MAG TPA: twin-arginine translocase TatA/TatE family subunit [Syntrophobacteraceae bacterium]|nr:twin-arginine translocase TatA/TatE family subunit [Syntrophobacteraceae bacterium]